MLRGLLHGVRRLHLVVGLPEGAEDLIGGRFRECCCSFS
jgi:hypothetical protein